MHLLLDTFSTDCLRELITGVINVGSAAPQSTSSRKEWARSSLELSQTPQVWSELDWVISVSKVLTFETAVSKLYSSLSEYWSLTYRMESLRNFPLLS